MSLTAACSAHLPTSPLGPLSPERWWMELGGGAGQEKKDAAHIHIYTHPRQQACYLLLLLFIPFQSLRAPSLRTLRLEQLSCCLSLFEGIHFIIQGFLLILQLLLLFLVQFLQTVKLLMQLAERHREVRGSLPHPLAAVSSLQPSQDQSGWEPLCLQPSRTLEQEETFLPVTAMMALRIIVDCCNCSQNLRS